MKCTHLTAVVVATTNYNDKWQASERFILLLLILHTHTSRIWKIREIAYKMNWFMFHGNFLDIKNLFMLLTCMGLTSFWLPIFPLTDTSRSNITICTRKNYKKMFCIFYHEIFWYIWNVHKYLIQFFRCVCT